MHSTECNDSFQYCTSSPVISPCSPDNHHSSDEMKEKNEWALQSLMSHSTHNRTFQRWNLSRQLTALVLTTKNTETKHCTFTVFHKKKRPVDFYIFAKFWTIFYQNYPVSMLKNVLFSTVKKFCIHIKYSLQSTI